MSPYGSGQSEKGALFMPSVLNYPGVYVEEIPSGVRTIVGGSTSERRLSISSRAVR